MPLVSEHATIPIELKERMVGNCLVIRVAWDAVVQDGRSTGNVAIFYLT